MRDSSSAAFPSKETGLRAKLRRLWRWHDLGPAVLASALGLGVLAARIYASGTYRYRFLVWNLFLAWVPYACSVALAEMKRRAVRRPRTAALLAVAWVLFLPNAPYLVTDFVHLFDAGDYAFWYDVGLIASFAWAGLVLTIASLRIVRQLLADRYGLWIARCAIAGTALTTGVGIYLGRVLRWNSWDVVTHPGMVMRFVAEVFGDPLGHRRGAVVSMVFAGLVWVCYVTFNAGNKERA